jgi:predicted enzyme related to lactoylglutathione lyase
LQRLDKLVEWTSEWEEVTKETLMKNSVSHFEIYADDPGGLAKFYSSLFDWNTEAVPGMDYTMLRTVDTDANGMPTKAGGINGGLLKRPAGFNSNAFVNYVNVDSVDTAAEKAQKLGAKVTKGKTAVPGMGWFVMLIDPQGNNFAVWQNDDKAK